MGRARRWLLVSTVVACNGSVGGTTAVDETSTAGSTTGSTTGSPEPSTGGVIDDDTIGVGPESTGSAEPSTGVLDEGDGSSTAGDTSLEDGCALVGIEGTCVDVVDCPAMDLALLGTCGDPPAVQCCLPDAIACSVDGAYGLCMPTAMCPPAMTLTAGLCPGAADVQCCSDPSTACDPNAEPTPNDGLVEESLDPSCPPGMLGVDDFCIDRWEASLVLVDALGQVIGSHSPFLHPSGANLRAVSIRGAVPQAYIDGSTAATACAAAGKRLCSDAEWLRACRGQADHTYPYGDVLEPGRCNDARPNHPVIEYFGTTDNWIWSQLGHRCIAQLPDGLQVTGAFPNCESDDGIVDMMGNLHEWTADPAGTFRGGYYVDTALNGSGCLYATTAHDSSHWDYSTGFRCCADP